MSGFAEQFQEWVGATPAQPAALAPAGPADALADAMLTDEPGVSTVFERIEALLRTEPERAWLHLTGIAAILGRVLDRHGGLPDRLASVVTRLRLAAQHVAAALKASQVTVQVGFPANVALSLTFPAAIPAPTAAPPAS